MRSLSSIVRDSDASDPLVQVVRALLDSGFILTTRDHRGLFVQVSPEFANALALDDGDARGQSFAQGHRFFDPAGREIAKADHPAHVARRTGVPERLRIAGVRAPNGHEAWMLTSYMPLDQGADGWSVLTIAAPLDRTTYTPPTRGSADPHGYEVPLLDFALETAGQRLGANALAERLAKPVAAIVTPTTSVSLMTRDGMMIHQHPIQRTVTTPVSPAFRISEIGEARWRQPGSVFIPDLRPTEIVGNRVAIEYEEPFRTYALIPVVAGDNRVASLAITAPEPDAVSGVQLQALESLGRLAGPILTT
jgi:hypothetical protein